MATEIVSGAAALPAQGQRPPWGSLEEWAEKASQALGEAATMQESMTALVELLIEDADAKSFPLLEAVSACMMRLDRATDVLNVAPTFPLAAAGSDSTEPRIRTVQDAGRELARRENERRGAEVREALLHPEGVPHG